MIAKSHDAQESMQNLPKNKSQAMLSKRFEPQYSTSDAPSLYFNYLGMQSDTSDAADNMSSHGLFKQRPLASSKVY